MSLTSFISIPEVRQRFAATFTKPPFKTDAKIVAEPLTNHYSLVGTAFDYLTRFYLRYLNPESIESPWVAELGRERLRRFPELFVTKGFKPREIKRALGKADDIISRAKKLCLTYERTGKITDDLIASAVCLSQLDLLFRPSIIDSNMGQVDKKDVEDLRNLISAIDVNLFKAEKLCVLNPTFGKGSELVGGADCDLLIDNILIDIKTTKTLKFQRDHFNQLVGYYILFTIGGVDGAPSANIKHVGIYYSRYSLLHTIPITTLTENTHFTEFKKWFEDKAQETFRLR